MKTGASSRPVRLHSKHTVGIAPTPPQDFQITGAFDMPAKLVCLGGAAAYLDRFLTRCGDVSCRCHSCTEKLRRNGATKCSPNFVQGTIDELTKIFGTARSSDICNHVYPCLNPDTHLQIALASYSCTGDSALHTVLT